ncbi:biosynthetic-type acetolactate synthase large subunit [Aquirufa nivalisilvae]|uniref:Acetolactate synthase n=1 Tax=Aquirufa nivalisilvae TaxID=2516557 RepID=A0A2S2DYR5_9BACT|nr:biosynthetic-type acetolactate synthase large subunit [Aquirufa nivalisilvae]AWL09917.1 Acetolactate synthase [Aquirufa nivalisilvae]MCZ2480539.1 biosynthetic-type acetolactate synthase large subunit [Aquirufa nivalisilvae]TBH70903.1 biosynthetic-type acetolactate synthase large subunit [Aquirufa nivalisilvae]
MGKTQIEATQPTTTQSSNFKTGAQAVMQSLVEQGVSTIFGYPGGAIMPTYDALFDYRDQLKHILVRHEQGAGHAAQGYARMLNKAGVCLVTSGPGATNLITPIADAMLDSTPLVCIVGQVKANLLGTDAFQECDVIGMSMPITKWNYQIVDPNEIPEIIAKAFYIAETGRPGPVLIEITRSAQAEMMSIPFKYQKCESIISYKPRLEPKEEHVEAAAKLINGAKRPYILAGHGVLISQAENELKEFVEKTGIPVATTLLGMSAMDADHPLFVGWPGMHGNYGANVLTNSCDVLIAIGMRFDDRITGDLSTYAKQAKVVHIEVDPSEIDKNVKADAPVVGDAKAALKALLPLVKKADHTEWRAEFKKYDDEEYEKITKKDLYHEGNQIKMGEAVALLSDKTKGEAVVVTDVGQHQMITNRYYRFKKHNSIVTSGGAGTMGFALPASFGAKVAVPEREVIAVIGDGGFQMTLQELGTIAQSGLPVKIIILNNNFLGMVRQWQSMFFDNRYSFVELQNPDFITIAKGFGIEGHTVSDRNNLGESLDTLLNSKKPYLLEIICEKEENVFPMVPAGACVTKVMLE